MWPRARYSAAVVFFLGMVNKVCIGNNEWEQFKRWELIGTERDSEEEICN